MIKLLVLDCDGVMFDSRIANITFYNHLLDHFGLPPMNEEQQEFVHIASVLESIERLFTGYDSPTTEEILKYKESIGYDSFLEYMQMEDDLPEFLEIVKKRYHLAISTNRTDTMIPLLQRYRLENYFEMVVTAATAGRPKPAPDGLLKIMSHFAITPQETLFVGDSTADLGQTRACNVRLVAFKNNKLEADYHVDNFMEILKLPILAQQKIHPESQQNNLRPTTA